MTKDIKNSSSSGVSSASVALTGRGTGQRAHAAEPHVGRENSIITEGRNSVVARMLSPPPVRSSEIVHLPRRIG
jgi:hypothetical protein